MWVWLKMWYIRIIPNISAKWQCLTGKSMINQWICGTGYFKQIHVASEKRGTSEATCEATSEARKSRFEESTWAKKVSRCCKVLPWRSSKDRPVARCPSGPAMNSGTAVRLRGASPQPPLLGDPLEPLKVKGWSDDEAMLHSVLTSPMISHSPVSTCFNSDFGWNCALTSERRPTEVAAVDWTATLGAAWRSCESQQFLQLRMCTILKFLNHKISQINKSLIITNSDASLSGTSSVSSEQKLACVCEPLWALVPRIFQPHQHRRCLIWGPHSLCLFQFIRDGLQEWLEMNWSRRMSMEVAPWHRPNFSQHATCGTCKRRNTSQLNEFSWSLDIGVWKWGV